MGKRRVRNLTFLQAGSVHGFDPRADRREESQQQFGITTFDSFDAAMANQPNALIISTPPDKHLPYMRAAAEAGIPFFSEASIFDAGLEEIATLCQKKGILGAASSTMRFNPSVRLIKTLLNQRRVGKPLAMSHHCGQYLPDWHPWEDYRAFYVARRETGACREMVPFELSWLTWLLGNVQTVSAMAGKVSDLKTEIDDVYQVLLQFEDGILGHLLVDVVSRHAFRSFKLLGSEGVITWEWEQHQVRLYDATKKAWSVFPEPSPDHNCIATDGMYVQEMRHFLAALRGEETYLYSLSDDCQVLRLLYSAEKSASHRVHVQTEDHPEILGQ